MWETIWTFCYKAKRPGRSSESLRLFADRKMVLMLMCVRYEWLGRKHKVSSSASRFSRYAEEKGLFSVKSVALKDNQVSIAGRLVLVLARRVNSSY